MILHGVTSFDIWKTWNVSALWMKWKNKPRDHTLNHKTDPQVRTSQTSSQTSCFWGFKSLMSISWGTGLDNSAAL